MNRPLPAVAARRPGKLGRRLYAELADTTPAVRRRFYATLDTTDWAEVLAAATTEAGTPYALWADDPVGFVEDVLGESQWSRQRDILEALVDNRRVAVPSCFGSGKTHIAARVAVWSSVVHPPGTALTVTAATRARQVQRQMWPHIRQVVARACLPGEVGVIQWKMPDHHGSDVVVAYGFSAPDHDEAAVQGIHAPRLMFIVDEAGGIGRIIGAAMRGVLTGEHTRALLIGNPPTDDEGSWFEQTCNDPAVLVLPISVYDTPLLSGERTRRCRACPAQAPAHLLATHLVDRQWVDDTIRDHGEDAPFVQAKVHARFPRGGQARAIPASWVERATDSPESDGPDYTPLNTLGLDGETSPNRVKRGAWIRLGVDVAADGGDEFVIARSVGDLVELRHSTAGQENADPVVVAGVVLREITAAQRLAAALGSTAPIRVKIDGVGLGWGVAGLLEAWRREGLHSAEIVAVLASEGTGRDDKAATLRPGTKRDEMWLAMRSLLSPNAQGALRLRGDRRTQAQMSAPKLETNSAGRTVIESKKSLRRRGVSSPDRAEAILLALYEPHVSRRRVRVIS
ncbi:DEAD/DEAH box helicase family protein [Kitasatospora sp. NPDC057198]|uniref:DEAD/DEAH box helicase family protein n=1 Tax=Kitasatospora sp. NPDC057198 TaxID=3346046 RepID=UPI0036392F8C